MQSLAIKITDPYHLLVQYYCNTEIIRKVPPQCFIPRPKVDSIVIKLERLKEEPRVKVQNEKLFLI